MKQPQGVITPGNLPEKKKLPKKVQLALDNINNKILNAKAVLDALKEDRRKIKNYK